MKYLTLILTIVLFSCTEEIVKPDNGEIFVYTDYKIVNFDFIIYADFSFRTDNFDDDMVRGEIILEFEK